MNKEKRKHLFLSFSILIFTFIFAFYCFWPNFYVAYATSEDIAVMSGVDVDDVATRFISYTSSEIINNIPANTAYYNSLLTNDANNNTLSDSSFSWSAGANVLNNDINKLVFTLNYNNTSAVSDYMMLSAYLYRANKDTNTADCLLEIKFWFLSFGSSQLLCYIKQYSFGSERLGFSYEDEFSFVGDGSISDDGYKQIGICASSGTYTPFYGTTGKQLHFIVDTEYLTDTYFMSFYNHTTSSRIDSKIVSVYDIVSQMNDRDELSYLTETEQEKANELLVDGTIKKIQVSWLEQIGETPFARKKYDWVEIPVVSDMISPSDVVEKLEIDSFSVGQSSCQYFKEDKSTGIYNAYYLKNVWLSSKDANGNSMNLFLDINVSYRDFYYPFVRDGIFTQGMYEWFWSTMIVKYPEISGIDDSDLYGYFGYTSVPYTYTLNQLIYEMFDGSPNMDGVVRYFSYRENLSYDSYMNLLNDYGCGWLEKAWNTVAGFLSGSKYPADHYFFYCDGTQDNAFIGENGADDVYDNGGALLNKAEDIGEALSAFLDIEISKYILGFILLLLLIVLLAPALPKLFGTIGNIFKALLKGILMILTAPFKLIGKLFKKRE